jgi:hypothetical protein
MIARINVGDQIEVAVEGEGLADGVVSVSVEFNDLVVAPGAVVD